MRLFTVYLIDEEVREGKCVLVVVMRFLLFRKCDVVASLPVRGVFVMQLIEVGNLYRCTFVCR